MIAGLKIQLNFTDPLNFAVFEIRGINCPHFIFLVFLLILFFFFPLSVQGLFVLFITDSADSVRAAELFLGLGGLCGAQGSYLSGCPPTSLLQEPKFMAMQKVDTTRWMSLTTVFQLQCSPQDKKPQGRLCSSCNLTWGNCSFCLSLRPLWAMKLDEMMCGSLLVDGWMAEHKTEDRMCAVLAVFSPEGHLHCCSNTLPCRYISALPPPSGHHWVSGLPFRKDKDAQNIGNVAAVWKILEWLRKPKRPVMIFFSSSSPEITGMVWNRSADGSHCRITNHNWNKA